MRVLSGKHSVKSLNLPPIRQGDGMTWLILNYVKEAIPLVVKYAWDQQQWGSQRRMQTIMAFLTGYGAHAKPMVPELRKLVEF
jgi:hypothetical protein